MEFSPNAVPKRLNVVLDKPEAPEIITPPPIRTPNNVKNNKSKKNNKISKVNCGNLSHKRCKQNSSCQMDYIRNGKDCKGKVVGASCISRSQAKVVLDNLII